jgi:hypothetical protein
LQVAIVVYAWRIALGSLPLQIARTVCASASCKCGPVAERAHGVDGARCLDLDPARQSARHSDRFQPVLMTNFDIIGAGSMASDAFLVTRGASSQL